MSEPSSTGPWSLIREPQFLRVWLAGALVGVMRWLDVLAVGVYTHQVTGDPLVVAIMLFLRMMPLLLFGVIIGAYAERVNRKHLLVAGVLSIAVVYAILTGLAYTGLINLYHIGIGAVVSGVFWAMEMPVRLPRSEWCRTRINGLDCPAGGLSPLQQQLRAHAPAA